MSHKPASEGSPGSSHFIQHAMNDTLFAKELKKTLRRLLPLLPLLGFGLGSLTAFCQPMASWPMFRGPNASGLAPNGTRTPTEFGPEKNQAWVFDAPSGYSSPIVWGDRLFLTGYSADPVKLELLCIDRTLGTERWRREIPVGGCRNP